jgi:hypothetical protein
MDRWIELHKPAARAGIHLALAWLMWVVVGTVMAGVGTHWLVQAAPEGALWIGAGAVVLGVIKSRTVLDGVARRTAHRIVTRGDGRCIGGFLSLRTWLLVLVMIVAGRILRGAVTRVLMGPLYVAVGTALVLSSRLTWRAWHERGA